MEFRHYDPKELIQEFKEFGVHYFSKVCYGCVFTGVVPFHCIHPDDEFESPEGVQSDLLCSHCYETAMESGEPFRFREDEDLSEKVKELEAIVRMSVGI